jgi:hypothetical protein
MSATANVTVTSDTGPEIQNTAVVYNGVTNINFQLDRETVVLTKNDGSIVPFDYRSITTVTYTISGKVATVALS